MRDWCSFKGWDEADILAFLEKNHVRTPRQLVDGTWCGIVELLFTTSVCMDITPDSAFKYRWCFEDRAEAEYLLATAQDFDEVPVRRTSLKGHRYKTAPLYTEKDELGIDKW